MWKLIATTLALASVAVAQQCNDEYGSYLQCIDNEVNNVKSPLAMEQEFRNDYKNILKECFDDSRGTGRCFWPDDRIDETTDPEWVFGNQGPLRGCRICQTIARAITQLLKQARPETLTCVRGVIGEEIRTLLTPCIQREQRGFVMPKLPDFERGIAPHKEELGDTVATFIMSVNRQRLCETNGGREDGPHTAKVEGICRDLRQAQADQANSNTGGGSWTRGKRTPQEVAQTQQCMKKGFLSTVNRPMWPTHCAIRKSCTAKVSGSCKSEFSSVERTACRCVQEETSNARDIIQEAYRDFEKIASVEAGDPETKGAELRDYRMTECRNIASGIIDYYTNERGIDVNGLFTKATNCAGGLNEATRQKFSLDNLIGMGCRMYSREAPCLTKDLAQAIRLGVDLLEALVNRVTRFCPQEFCQV